MGNSISSNLMAMRTLNSLNKNIKKKEQAAHHLSLGELIGSAGDDASRYSIGEKMKVRIRALGQDHNNVQNGAALLHVAEGGIQRQIDILRNIKRKVIEAANDTNTDSDRQTIQKEINQGWDQIEAIADETEYNGIKVLHGVDTLETIKSWNYLPEAAILPGSDDMDIVPNVYATLDGKIGPFDVFADYDRPASTIPSLNLAEVNTYTKTAGTPNTWSIDFSAFTSPAQLEGCSFTLLSGSRARFVFTANPNDQAKWPANVIDISGCATMDDVLNQLANTGLTKKYTAGWSSIHFDASRDGNKITITANEEWDQYNDDFYTPKGYAQDAMVVDSTAAATGRIANPSYFTGGADAVGLYGDQQDGGYQPPKSASISIDNFYPETGQGFILHLIDDYFEDRIYDDIEQLPFKFVDGNAGMQWGDESHTYITIGKDAVLTNAPVLNQTQDLYLTYYQGHLEFKASAGRNGNYYYLTDGGTQDVTSYHALHSLTEAGATVENHRTGVSASMFYDIDLSSYNTTDAATLESFIQDLTGKALIIRNRSAFYKDFVDFYDSGKAPAVASLTTMQVERNLSGRFNIPSMEKYADIDLNDVRTKVLNDGETIANAFADLMADRIDYLPDITKKVDANGNATDLILYDDYEMLMPDPSKFYVYKPVLRHYDLDYGTWFQNNTAKLAGGVASYLDGKGFRAYCASDSAEWFNFAFHDGKAEERPMNLLSGENIRTIDIDVSGVTDAASLVTAIYDQAEPQLQSRNHYMHLAADADTGVLTLYDDRRYKLQATDWPDLQEKGAKIADGCYYNPLEGYRDIHGGNFVIQHTDKADFNIHLHIPRTTMAEIFGYDPAQVTPENFNVLTAEKREMLLGTQAKDGESGKTGQLDIGLEYLLSAVTLVGAQTKRLEYADANIVTDQESTTASESAIRDVDMAKEMTAYVKANVLTQAAQAMLAQTNQRSAEILQLLQ